MTVARSCRNLSVFTDGVCRRTWQKDASHQHNGHDNQQSSNPLVYRLRVLNSGNKSHHLSSSRASARGAAGGAWRLNVADVARSRL
jgi:hypothetical protein